MPRKGHFYWMLPLFRHRLKPLLSITLALLATGCQVNQGLGWSVLQQWQYVASAEPQVARLDSRFEFLQMKLGDGPAAYLALGKRVGSGESWYSADPLLVVLDDGRLGTFAGAPLEWRLIRQSGRPDWERVLRRNGPQRWQRQRDEMPGYRFGLNDEIETQRVPTADLPAELQLIDERLRARHRDLLWVGDRISSTDPSGYPVQMRQWFAVAEHVGRLQVAWSRQCMRPGWCIEFRPVWNP
jgi:hypothetical protein